MTTSTNRPRRLARRAIKLHHMLHLFQHAPHPSVVAPRFERPLYEAALNLFKSARTENGHPITECHPEDNYVEFKGEDLLRLLDAVGDFNEYGYSAEDACRANLIVGLIGGAAITAGTFGIFSLARRRRTQRRNGNK